MNTSKCWLAVLVAGIVGNALDFVVQGQFLTNAYYAKMSSMRTGVTPIHFIIADFVAVAVLAWVLKRVAVAFTADVRGGAVAGFYLGVLINIPAYYFIHLMVREYSRRLCVISTVYGVIWYVIVGAILGGLMKKPATAAAPA